MQSLTERLLASAETLSAKLGPVTGLMDRLAGRLMPGTVAKACGGILCYLYCSYDYCNYPHPATILYAYYSSPGNGCPVGIYQCGGQCGCE